MNKQLLPRFVQISATADTLYALDENGIFGYCLVGVGYWARFWPLVNDKQEPKGEAA